MFLQFLEEKLKYLANKYYTREEDTDLERRGLLMKALGYLQEHHEGKGPFVAEYPRVLILLGEDYETVKPAYDHELPGIPIDRIKQLEHKGLFCELFEEFDEAEKCWREVQKMVTEEQMGYTSFTAIHGLKRLAVRVVDNRPDCDTLDNWRIR